MIANKLKIEFKKKTLLSVKTTKETFNFLKKPQLQVKINLTVSEIENS